MLDLTVAPPRRAQEQEAHWSLRLLGELDWLRFQELMSRLLHRAGYVPEVAWTRPDGGTALTLVHPARPHRLEAVVQCAPWAAGEIEASALQELLAAVTAEGAQRGIFVTPGLFRPEARNFARLKPLELVDGSDLLRTLQQMPPPERAHFLGMTTVGPYMIPSCPSCAKKMALIDDCAAALGQHERDLVFKSKGVEPNEINCRSLTLKKSADLVFLKSVTAGSMTVHGQATGNIVVNGRLHIADGGCLSGLVSARAIRLDPGGTLEAEARILNEAELAHITPMPLTQIWRCPAHPKCRATLPVRQVPASG